MTDRPSICCNNASQWPSCRRPVLREEGRVTHSDDYRRAADHLAGLSFRVNLAQLHPGSVQATVLVSQLARDPLWPDGSMGPTHLAAPHHSNRAPPLCSVVCGLPTGAPFWFQGSHHVLSHLWDSGKTRAGFTAKGLVSACSATRLPGVDLVT
jgi:hypothetical protein